MALHDGKAAREVSMKILSWKWVRTILSIVQTGFASSGLVEMQLSMGYPPPLVDPPQIKTPRFSVYGAY